jgi:hypothetical protein
MTTGNGNFTSSANDWGDTVFSLNPDGTGAGASPLDSYTPSNYQTLNEQDLDLGSTAPAIFPIPANCPVGRLVLQSGKDGVMRLLNLDNLTEQGGPGHTGGEVSASSVPQGGEVLTHPATWLDPTDGSSWVFVANGAGIAGLRLTVSQVNGQPTPSFQTIWVRGLGVSSPIVATNVLYEASSGSVQAMSPTTGATLWQGAIGGIHWESPIVVNSTLYVTDENSHLTAFAPSSQLLQRRVVAQGSTIFLPLVNADPFGC